jgi:hypothetical protein
MLSTPKTFEKQSVGDTSSAEQIEQDVFFYQNNAFLQLIFHTKTPKNVPMM